MKKWLLSVGAIILILLLTNPSLRDFKDFAPTVDLLTEDAGRQSNYLVFSIYIGYTHSKGTGGRWNSGQHYRNKYLGIMKNFYLISSIPSTKSFSRGPSAFR